MEIWIREILTSNISIFFQAILWAFVFTKTAIDCNQNKEKLVFPNIDKFCLILLVGYYTVMFPPRQPWVTTVYYCLTILAVAYSNLPQKTKKEWGVPKYHLFEVNDLVSIKECFRGWSGVYMEETHRGYVVEDTPSEITIECVGTGKRETIRKRGRSLQNIEKIEGRKTEKRTPFGCYYL